MAKVGAERFLPSGSNPVPSEKLVNVERKPKGISKAISFAALCSYNPLIWWMSKYLRDKRKL